jgi:tight adherence protein B
VPVSPAAIASLLAGAAVLVTCRALPIRRRRWPCRPVRPFTLLDRIRRIAVDAGLDPEPNRALRRWLATAAILPVLVISFGSVAGVAGAVAWATTPAVAARIRRSGRAARRDAQLPEALESVASALRSGTSLTAAIHTTAARTPDPLGTELGEVTRAAGSGRGLAPSLDLWADRADTSAVRLAATALALGAETGGSVARAVDGVAATLRDRRAVAAEAGSLATQARASATLIAAAPLGFAALVITLDPEAGAMLVGSPLGWLCLLGGLGLDAAGAAWMAHIVRQAR